MIILTCCENNKFHDRRLGIQIRLHHLLNSKEATLNQVNVNPIRLIVFQLLNEHLIK